MDIQRDTRKSPRKKITLAIGACVVLLAAMAALRGLGPAVPTVDRAALWSGRVERGLLLRQVKGTGVLVPEQIRWITSATSGRVVRIHARPGSVVTPEVAVLELENPDLMLQTLQAERELATARADLLRLRRGLRADALADEAVSVALHNDLAEARRRAVAQQGGEGEIFTSLDTRQTQDRAASLQRQAALADAKVALLRASLGEELVAQGVQVSRYEDVHTFRRKQLEELNVRAGGDGVLQDVLIELGQWVVPGTVLAKIVVPERLKAELQIPEVQAKDIAPGQPVVIDTHAGTVNGSVSRIATAANQGTVKLEVALSDTLPKGARPDLNVDGYIETERILDAVYVARPVGAQPESDLTVFRIEPHGGGAVRVPVHTGRASVDKIEVTAGLVAGDEIVLSDVSKWASFARITLK